MIFEWVITEVAERLEHCVCPSHPSMRSIDLRQRKQKAPFLQAAIRVFILLVGVRKTTSTKTGEPLYMKNHHCGRVTLRQRSPPSPAQGPGARNAQSHCFGDLTPDPVFLHKQLKRQLSQLQYQLFIVNFAFLSKLRIPVLYFLQQL